MPIEKDITMSMQSLPSTGSRAIAWVLHHTQALPVLNKHCIRLLYGTNVCNLCYSIYLVLLTNIKVSYSISVYIRETCFLLLFNTISDPFPLKWISWILEENHCCVPWKTRLKTMTSINRSRNTVYKYMTFNVDILSVIL